MKNCTLCGDKFEPEKFIQLEMCFGKKVVIHKSIKIGGTIVIVSGSNEKEIAEKIQILTDLEKSTKTRRQWLHDCLLLTFCFSLHFVTLVS